MYQEYSIVAGESPEPTYIYIAQLALASLFNCQNRFEMQKDVVLSQYIYPLATMHACKLYATTKEPSHELKLS